MSELVTLSRHGDVAVLTIDNPPVNALSPGVPEAIQSAVETAANDPAVKAIVVIGAGTTFIAGADIKEFGKVASGEAQLPDLAAIIRRIEDSPKLVVMALHGTAFGGGLEVAMGGHYRVIAAGAKVGQPEVKIGLIPGAAGTQRLPRLAGMAQALTMCAFGEPIGAEEALACGIADRMIEGDLLAGAIAFAREIAEQPFTKVRERTSKLRDADPILFAAARDAAHKNLRGQEAPLAAIEAVEASLLGSFEDGCRIEHDLFNRCLRSSQSKALIYAFFAERTVAKIPGIPKDADIVILEAGRLLEIVRHETASKEAIATAMALARKLKRVAVVSNNGSIGKRMFDRYLREAQLLVKALASAEQVNNALYEFGMAEGPLPPSHGKPGIISNEEIVDRCMAGLADEGARLLAEGIALRAVDIDMVFVHGYGFPAWRGGPMFYAENKCAS
jgi:enoyl-CoA hydratase/carnithine racemase